MLKKSSVQLREKLLANGDKRLYLDIYNEGKREYEFLKLKIVKAVSPEMREINKQTQLKAEAVRNRRESELISGEFEIKTKHRLNNSFLTYFKTYRDNYKKKNYRVIHSVYAEFCRFIEQEDIAFNQITAKLMYQFKENLEGKYNGETPSDYFSKFKRVIQQAILEDYFLKDPTKGISIKRNSVIKKDVLTVEEIQLLANTACGNNEVRRAFLFACNSGLRLCDVVRLKYEHIRGNNIHIVQSKTENEVVIPISNTIKKILGEKKANEDFVFNLPSHTATNKVLKNWVNRAEIEKKITFHCARHSYGTNLIFYGNDVLVTSELMGHKDLRQTQNYVRIANSQKRKAINSLPELSLSA